MFHKTMQQTQLNKGILGDIITKDVVLLCNVMFLLGWLITT